MRKIKLPYDVQTIYIFLAKNVVIKRNIMKKRNFLGKIDLGDHCG